MKLQTINYTQIPNEILDNMSELSDVELRVLLAICRKTIGYHKDTDRISHGQLQKITGLSVHGIKTAREKLIKKGLITYEITGSGKNTETWYDINISSGDTLDNANVSSGDIKKPSNISPEDTTKESKKRNNINKYAEFVSMTEEEYNKLIEKYGQEQTQKMVEKLDNFKGARGKKYKNDYRAILSWVVDAVKAVLIPPRKKVQKDKGIPMTLEEIKRYFPERYDEIKKRGEYVSESK
jgi:phage replication O-like protein O